MIDSHCHLADTRFADDLEGVLERAREAGVERMVTIATSFEEGEKGIAVAEKYTNVFATVGVHPHESSKWEAESSKRLEKLVRSSDRVVGLGEIGLDYHYMHSPKEIQKKVFKEQLQMGKELGLPIILHTREAIEDTWAIVDAMRPEKLVVHCCSERYEDIVRFLERGYLVSFTGMITYPKAEELRRTVEQCPLTQMMIETDAPYLAPKKFRGKRNEPAYVVEVAKTIAEVKGVSLEEVDRVTTANTIAFFNISSFEGGLP